MGEQQQCQTCRQKRPDPGWDAPDPPFDLRHVRMYRFAFRWQFTQGEDLKLQAELFDTQNLIQDERFRKPRKRLYKIGNAQTFAHHSLPVGASFSRMAADSRSQTVPDASLCSIAVIRGSAPRSMQVDSWTVLCASCSSSSIASSRIRGVSSSGRMVRNARKPASRSAQIFCSSTGLTRGTTMALFPRVSNSQMVLKPAMEMTMSAAFIQRIRSF